MTNSAGRSYVRSGNHYDEIAGEAGEGDPKFSDRQFKVTYTLKVYKHTSDVDETPVAVTPADLAGIADTYNIKIKPTLLVKASQTQTEALGTKGLTPSADTAATAGALKETAGAAFNISEAIEITDAGAISWNSTTKTPAEMLTGVTFVVYGGLAVNSEEQQDWPTIQTAFASQKLQVEVGHTVSTVWTPLA